MRFDTAGPARRGTRSRGASEKLGRGASNDCYYTVRASNRAMIERRNIQTGTISVVGGTIDCTVHNITSAGAAVEVETLLQISDRFTLIVPSDQLRKPCHVIWRLQRRLAWRSTKNLQALPCRTPWVIQPAPVVAGQDRRRRRLREGQIFKAALALVRVWSNLRDLNWTKSGHGTLSPPHYRISTPSCRNQPWRIQMHSAGNVWET